MGIGERTPDIKFLIGFFAGLFLGIILARAAVRKLSGVSEINRWSIIVILCVVASGSPRVLNAIFFKLQYFLGPQFAVTLTSSRNAIAPGQHLPINFTLTNTDIQPLTFQIRCKVEDSASVSWKFDNCDQLSKRFSLMPMQSYTNPMDYHLKAHPIQDSLTVGLSVEGWVTEKRKNLIGSDGPLWRPGALDLNVDGN